MEGNRLFKCKREYVYNGNIIFKKDSFYYFEDKDDVVYTVDEQGEEYWANGEFAEDYFDYATKREIEIWEGKTSTIEETEAWMSVKEGKKEEPKGFLSRDHLTKREIFAAMAMQGMLSNSYYAEAWAQSVSGDDSCSDVSVANRSIEMADAILKALK